MVACICNNISAEQLEKINCDEKLKEFESQLICGRCWEYVNENVRIIKANREGETQRIFNKS